MPVPMSRRAIHKRFELRYGVSSVAVPPPASISTSPAWASTFLGSRTESPPASDVDQCNAISLPSSRSAVRAAGSVPETLRTRRSPARRNSGSSRKCVSITSPVARSETIMRTSSRPLPRSSAGSCASSSGGSANSIALISRPPQGSSPRSSRGSAAPHRQATEDATDRRPAPRARASRCSCRRDR